MQITLTEREIHTALRKYIATRLHLSDSEEIKIELTATRGADGFKALLDICEPEAAPVVERSLPAPIKKVSEPVKEVEELVIAPAPVEEKVTPVEVIPKEVNKGSSLFSHLAM